MNAVKFAIINVCKRIGKWWLMFKPFGMASILCLISKYQIRAFFSPIQTTTLGFYDPRVPVFPFQMKAPSSISPSLIEAFFSPSQATSVQFYEPRVMFYHKLNIFYHFPASNKVNFHPFQTIGVRLFPNKFRHRSATILTSSDKSNKSLIFEELAPLCQVI